MQKKTDSRGAVYSTEHGRMCPDCGHPASACTCRHPKNAPKNDGIVRVGWETKGRKGKGVTLISGIPPEADGLRRLASQLKQQCGSGGTVKDGIIEIQGDHRNIVLEELKKQGYNVKRAGG